MKKLIYLGADSGYPEYLQRKIILSNQIACFIAFLVALPFACISFIYFRPIWYLPAVGMVVCVSTLFFNYIKFHTLARTIISLLPIGLSTVFGAYLSHKGEAVIPGIAMITLSFSFVIFLVFDLREKAMLIIMSIIMVTMVMSMDWLNNWFEIELDTQIIETGFLAKISILVSILTGAGSIFILLKQNEQAEEKSAELLNLSDTNFKNMKAKEQDLQQTLNRLEEAKKEDQKRQWCNEGLTQALELIRTQNDLEKLCNEVLSFTIRYVKANQGGIFIVNNVNSKEEYLELTAAYAYERKKFVKKRIEIGEGLLGQAYLEKDCVYLNEVPEDYLNITSGLGTANPSYLLIVPLMIDEHILGVMELASFKEFVQFEIDFLKQLGHNLASVIQQKKVTNDTQALVGELQQKTEEMRAQEEEMRQNLEEMQATQEELGRKNLEITNSAAESEGVLNAVNATMATIEFTPTGIINNANVNFLKTMGYALTDIQGKHHKLFVSNDIQATEDYKTFWSRLASGTPLSGTFKRIDSEGETIWLNAIYNPILDAEGKVVSVMKLATEVSQHLGSGKEKETI